MNETIKTRCPLCSAPVVVQIAEDGPFYDGPNCRPTRIRYEYDEPERLPPLTDCAGYDLNELRFVALLLRKHDIRPEDLRRLIGDFGRIAEIMAKERATIEKNIMAEALGRFNSGSLAEFDKVHWMRPGPSPITPGQFNAIYDDEEGEE